MREPTSFGRQENLRVVKGFFVTRERPFLFPVNCEVAKFFLVKRDLVTEPRTVNRLFFA